MKFKGEKELNEIVEMVLGERSGDFEKRELKIADVGAGKGDLKQVLKMWFKDCSYQGFDKNLINKKQGVKRLDFSKKVRIKDKFDIVFCLDVIEHVKNTQVILKNIKELVKDNGLIVISTPNLNSLSRYLMGKSWFGFKDKSHLRLFGKKELIIELALAGFKIEFVKTKSMSRFSWWNWLAGVMGLGGQLVVGVKKSSIKKINRRLTMISLGEGNVELWSKKIKEYLKLGLTIKLVGVEHKISQFKKELGKEIDYVVVKGKSKSWSKYEYLFEMVKRNILGLVKIKKIARQTEVFLSTSAVLDELVIIWIIIKLFRRGRKWVILFENEVELDLKRGLIGLLSWLFYRISLVLIKQADKVLVVSKRLKDILVEMGVDDKKVIITGNAVDVIRIKKVLKILDKEKFKKRNTGLYMGRIDEKKGIFDLIEIIKRVVKEISNFQLVVAGSGDKRMEKRFREIVKRKGLDKNIKMVGYVKGDKKYQLLGRSKVFVFPSYSESFGVAVLEAVVSGLSVVCYDLDVFKKLYKNDQVKMVAKGDIARFSDQLIKQLRKKGKVKSRLTDDSWFNYQRIAKIEYEVINSC